MLEGGIRGLQMRDPKACLVQPFKRPTSATVRTDLLPNVTKLFRSEQLRVLAAVACPHFHDSCTLDSFGLDSVLHQSKCTRPRYMPANVPITSRLSALRNLWKAELRYEWRPLFKRPEPDALRKDLMVRVLA